MVTLLLSSEPTGKGLQASVSPGRSASRHQDLGLWSGSIPIGIVLQINELSICTRNKAPSI